MNLFLVACLMGVSATMYAFTDGDLPTTQQTYAYIRKYKVLAISEMIRGGVPASIKLAQGILETASGTSALAMNANNHFGIKCGNSWAGTTYYHWDDEPMKSCFRVYESPEQSYVAHTDFLRSPQKRQRYGFLFKSYSNTDYRNWAIGLQKAGYATSQTYAAQLIAIIEWYELYNYDIVAKSFMSFPKDKAISYDQYEWLLELDLIQDYVNYYRYTAINDMQQSGIPASIKLALGIWESKAGSTELALRANNHFALKCDGTWKGGTYRQWQSNGGEQCFKNFASPEQAYKEHTAYLVNIIKQPRYSLLFKSLHHTNYKGWATALHKLTNAASPYYASQLIWIIEQYELYKLDLIQTTILEPTVAKTEFQLSKPQSYLVSVPMAKKELPPTQNIPTQSIALVTPSQTTLTSIRATFAEKQLSYDKDKWLFDNHKIQAYIDLYKDVAINEMHRCGIPASIKLAQGILESKAGESELAIKANNHFSLSCESQSVQHGYHLWSAEGVETCYHLFASPQQAYAAHTDYLKDPIKNDRFQFLFEYLLDADYKVWASMLQKLGYSSSKNYAAQLIWIIEQYKLYQFDNFLPQLEILPIQTLPAGKLLLNKTKSTKDSLAEKYDHDKIKAYVDRYKHIAIAEMDRSGVPASIKMAQGILESGSGESELATKANNHFGIKCGGDWTGDTHYVWDDEPVKSCFRVYPNAEQCYVEHTEFLRNPKKEYRYGFLFKEVALTDYKAWAKGLQSAGYATSKTYAEKLISLIERYELYKLDHLTLKTSEVSEQELALIFNVQKDAPKYETKSDTFTGLPDVLVPKDVWANFVTDSVVKVHNNKIFIANNLQTVLAPENKTIQEIARQYHIKPRKLLRFNELKGRKLVAGQYLYLHKKHKHYKGDTVRHIVRRGQTMYDIAQYYGVRQKYLFKLNRAYRDIQPDTGVQVFLK